MSSSKNIIQRLVRRAQKWWALDPEFADYLPEKHTQYRYPSPASQPDAMIPRQEFIKDFHIKYYQRDYRTHATFKDAPYANSEVIFRQEIIKKPFTVLAGEPVGPFYGFGMENRTSYVIDERDNKQVYAHKKSLNVFRPEDIATKDEEVVAQMEQDLTYKGK